MADDEDLLSSEPGENTMLRAAIDSIQQTGHGNFEARHRCKDGRVLDVHFSVRVIQLHGRKLLVGVWRDIGQRKAAEKVLAAQKKLWDARKVVFDKASAAGVGEILANSEPAAIAGVFCAKQNQFFKGPSHKTRQKPSWKADCAARFLFLKAELVFDFSDAPAA